MRLASQNRIFLSLIFGAMLFVRALVPAGWMPSSTAGQWVSLCSGSGETQAWLDGAGKLHKEGAPSSQKADVQCVFAGLDNGFDPPKLDIAAPAPAPVDGPAPRLLLVAAVGLGLAAPPPPTTGPPFLN